MKVPYRYRRSPLEGAVLNKPVNKGLNCRASRLSPSVHKKVEESGRRERERENKRAKNSHTHTYTSKPCHLALWRAGLN